ncbi:hypothetical protein [Sediminibacterium soli]|uniref:hypothetical protein n=1 Tax=Sediminibacterium soli TaxID=2698829 RepID=UPI00137A2074|nr:hypothetical protein [Sediminibacterium soli]NCI45921.1 hypothetical protein [Sediminibacterium soli]
MNRFRNLFVLLTLTLSLTAAAYGQEFLPAITVRELTQTKVGISWNNPHPNCIQLAIQRSTDSISNFRTIFSSLSPELPSNGFVDNKPIRGMKSYYRIFYVLEGGAYYFSKVGSAYIPWINQGASAVSTAARDMISIHVKGVPLFKLSKQAYARFRDSINRKTKDGLRKIDDYNIEWKPVPVKKGVNQLVTVYDRERPLLALGSTDYQRFRDSIATKTKDTLYMVDPFRIQLRKFTKAPDFISVYRNDSLIRQLPFNQYVFFRDSLATNTKDTLFSRNAYRLEIRPFYPRYAWRPSAYVFTNSKGYVTILLPEARQHRYHIIFYDADNSELFQIKSIKETELFLDKTNFVHAGWFSFELYEDDKLKEKNKFLLTKD